MNRKQKKKKHKPTRKREKKQKLRQDRKKKEKLSSQQGRTRTRTAGIRFPFDVGNELRTAVQYHQAGQLEKAEEIYKRILKIDPTHSDALHLLGLVADQAGDKERAIKLISKAIKNNPNAPMYYVNLGCTFYDVGQLSKAISAYEQALNLRPDLPEAYNNMASALLLQGKSAEAITCCQKALELQPNYFEAYNNLGNALQSRGRVEEAISSFQKAVELRPGSPESHNNLGQALQAQGKSAEAVTHCQKALELQPDFAEAHTNVGNVLESQGRFEDAMSCFEEAIKLKPDLAQAYNGLGRVWEAQHRPDNAATSYKTALELNPGYPEAYNNLGNLLQRQGKADEATSCYLKAVEVKPDYFEAYNNLGNLLLAQGKAEEAIAYYQMPLKLNPDQAETYNNMGLAFENMGKSDEAVSCYQKAVKLRPDLGEAHNNLVHALQQICCWIEFKDVATRLDEITQTDLEKQTKTAETPFVSITRHTDQACHYSIAKSYSTDISGRVTRPLSNAAFQDRQPSKGKITVGYLSSDFFDHATAHLMLSLFGLHDRNEFEILCYSYGRNDGSYFREKIRKDSDRFVDLLTRSHRDAAQQIFQDRVDILVDLKGYTKGNRLEICAHRPAPVQVTYLGFPGTTGADFIDYLITDRTVTPESYTPYYSEKFVYLPHTYQVNDHTQTISVRKWRKRAFGLPESTFVFSSFNQAYKIEPIIFDVWMEILRQVPKSVLWLQVSNETAKRKLAQEAEARGISGDRLIFAEKLPKDEHLARLKLADLALDTRIVNGHTTTSDALWAGVPVITLQGSHFASRVSSSILTAIGLPELITNSSEEYEALAVRLARDAGELKAIREKLGENRLTEPLFDTPQFVRNLEKAYAEMWKIFLTGEKPRQIEVVES